MNKVLWWLSVTVVFCIIGGGVSFAGKGPKFKEMDKNKDGSISQREFKQEKKQQRERKRVKAAKKKRDVRNWWEKRADTNNDGVVDAVERDEWKKLIKERIDIDGDGVISPKERRLSWRHARCRVNTKVEKQYDANNDGWLEPDEVREMLKARQALIKTKGKAKVDSAIEEDYDANEDGIIDKEESKALIEDTKPDE